MIRLVNLVWFTPQSSFSAPVRGIVFSPNGSNFIPIGQDIFLVFH